jgi:peptidoglycan hydrolase-like protein with peptidoglycan-binding domain
MGKCLTSLLILVSLVVSPETFGNDETRRLQKELRNRHFFYGDLDGEYNAELATAVRRYQTRKGFAPTGLIDRETLASLGIVRVTPSVPATAFAGNRGANGELLPTPAEQPEEPAWANLPLRNIEHEIRFQRLPAGLFVPDGVDKAVGAPTGASVELATSSAMSAPPVSSMRNKLDLRVAPAPAWNLASDEETQRVRTTAAPARAGRRHARRSRPQQQPNPVLTAFQTVDRFVHRLFDDTAPRGKRAPRRL